MFDSIELQHELMEAQKTQNDKEKEHRFKVYMASVRCGNDIQNLSSKGFNDKEISEVLDVSTSFVRDERSRHSRMMENRRKFMMTGQFPDEYPHVSIFQSK